MNEVQSWIRSLQRRRRWMGLQCIAAYQAQTNVLRWTSHCWMIQISMRYGSVFAKAWKLHLGSRLNDCLFYILFYINMVLYRSYYILQRPAGFLILDLDKSIVTTETSLSTAKRFIDMILDSAPSIDAVNEFSTD